MLHPDSHTQTPAATHYRLHTMLAPSLLPTLAISALALAHTAAAYQYTVGVGKNEVTGDPGIGFDPSRTVIADSSASNTIQFSFLEGIHRVVQVSAQDPCAFAGGFDSGVLSVPNGTLQGQGPTATFNVQNNSDVLYFADIATDYSPCYLGAVFCLNTDESSSTTSCYAVKAKAQALGTQYGVSTTPSLPSSATASAASSSTSMSSTSSATSSASSGTVSGAGASRTASASAASASASSSSKPSSGASSLKAGVVGAVVAVAAVAAAMA
ncbi:hypothetical protein OF846_003320 [Rhodotorula toruloides]|nr:hypothetical protein OF846_003320 [Rhodotorula toruloides]